MTKRNKIIIIVLIVFIVLGTGSAIVKTRLAKNLEGLTQVQVSNIDLTSVVDGVYAGSYSSFPVAAEVKVTVKNHRITAIELVKHTNGQGAAAEAIPGKVLEKQTLDVEAVSGATYSSKVIIKAIEMALTKS